MDGAHDFGGTLLVFGGSCGCRGFEGEPLLFCLTAYYFEDNGAKNEVADEMGQDTNKGRGSGGKRFLDDGDNQN
jgi:hypothetical protein